MELGQHACPYGLLLRYPFSYLALHPDDGVDEGEGEDQASPSGHPTTLKEVVMLRSAKPRSDHIRSCSDGSGDSSQASSMIEDEEWNREFLFLHIGARKALPLSTVPRH